VKESPHRNGDGGPPGNESESTESESETDEIEAKRRKKSAIPQSSSQFLKPPPGSTSSTGKRVPSLPVPRKQSQVQDGEKTGLVDSDEDEEKEAMSKDRQSKQLTLKITAEKVRAAKEASQMIHYRMDNKGERHLPDRAYSLEVQKLEKKNKDLLRKRRLEAEATKRREAFWKKRQEKMKKEEAEMREETLKLLEKLKEEAQTILDAFPNLKLKKGKLNRKQFKTVVQKTFGEPEEGFGEDTEEDHLHFEKWKERVLEENQDVPDLEYVIDENERLRSELFALKFDPKSLSFFGKVKDRTKKKKQGFEIIENIQVDWAMDNFHHKFLGLVVICDNQFYEIPLGDPGNLETKAEEIKNLERRNLFADVTCEFQQGEERYCLTYGFVSCLFYLNEKRAGNEILKQAEYLSLLPRYDACNLLCDLMLKSLPAIGYSRQYNVFNKKRSRRKSITAEELCEDLKPHPTLLILEGKDGAISHAVTIVDDLIFDSTLPKALKLCLPSFEAIMSQNEGFYSIAAAYRFDRKASKKHKWSHALKKNW